jgi:5-methyltetrahydrofolate--homocysteine methyltransferase
VYGFFPAASEADDVVLFTDDERRIERTRIPTMRQQASRDDGRPLLALADFVAPRESGVPDYVGAFAVTAGLGIEEIVASHEREHDDYGSIMVKALADRLAEAFAEMLHQRARRDWGYGRGERLTAEDLIRERYRGIRPAPGYPACPDHSVKRTLFDLLHPEQAAGIRLTENYAMHPAAAVSGWYFSHPEARYFAVGRVGRDQVVDLARRKGLSVSELERLIGPNLAYDA